MTTAQTIPAKYVYLDVVRFTKDRSVDAQSDIVHSLNKIVSESISELKIEKENLILLPTGDGMCVALLNVEIFFEIHLQLALSILKRLHEHNKSTRNKMRKFQVRIGINANVDNLVTDINGNRNVAGDGINNAARIMSVAEENQIFVSNSVYDTLKGREKYMKSFKHHWKTVKHGDSFAVYQYIAKKHNGLNIKYPIPIPIPIPIVSAEPSTPIKKLPQLVAYYIAHAIKNKDLFLEKIKNKLSYEGKILLWFLANESLEFSNATDAEKKYNEVTAKTPDSMKARYEHYEKQDFWLQCVATKVIDKEIRPFSEYFEDYDSFIFVTLAGVQRLKEECPDIWQEFELDSV